MKLLQIPTAQLEDRIKDELEENPALEYGTEDSGSDEYSAADLATDEFEEAPDEHLDVELSNDGADKIDLEEYLRSEDEGWGTPSYDYTNEDDEDGPGSSTTSPLLLETSFHERLMEQLKELAMDDRRTAIGEQIIGSIDDDGYLRREVPSLVDDLAFARNITTTPAEVEEIIARIRTFDPPGVGAWTLEECLLLQLRRMKPQSRTVRLATIIIEAHFFDFTRKNYDRILRTLAISEEEFKQAISLITHLTPRPGAAIGPVDKVQTYILPDFFVYNDSGKIEVTLNAKNAPNLRISDNYRDMLEAYDRGEKKNKQQKEALNFIKQKLDAAKWFIDAIRQRQQTLMQTMQAIVDLQRAFFLSGDDSTLRPMVLRDVAEATNLDISTISRTANSKFVQTEYGTFRLKYFFSETMHTESGEEVSNREIKSHLMSFIAEEDKHNPLSDDLITDMLKEKGYNVARRTIAKYREGLNIPIARLRRGI